MTETEILLCALGLAGLIACIPLARINDDYMRKQAARMTNDDLQRELGLSNGQGDHQIFAEEWARRQAALAVKKAKHVEESEFIDFI